MAVNSPVSRRTIIFRVLGVVLLLMAFLLLFYGTIAYVAWQSGEQLRVAQAQEEQAAELQKQFTLAETDVAAGRLELALYRLDWILAQDSGFAGAELLRTQVHSQLAAALTPSAPAVTATLEVEETQTAEEQEENTAAAEEQFEALELLMDGRDWPEAIVAIPEFQQDFPSYKRRETDTMLYTAYVAYGRSLLPGEQVALGVFYLEQARTLGDLTEEVEGEVTFAELYLEGIVFYDVNWPAFFYYFRELCLYAPLFHDSCDLLGKGLVRYGDQLAGQLDWCPAEGYYQEADNVLRTADELLPGKLDQAQANCLLATPTPAVITGTVPITGSEVITP